MAPTVNRFGMVECPMHKALNQKIMDPYGFMDRILDEAEGIKKVKREWKPAAKSLNRIKHALELNDHNHLKTAKAIDIKLGTLRNYIYYMRKIGMLENPEKKQAP